MVEHGLADLMNELIDDMPPAVLHAIADALASRGAPDERRNRATRVVTAHHKRVVLARLLEDARGDADLRWISVALESHARSSHPAAQRPPQLLWTGPSLPQQARALSEGLLHVITSAREHLWMVSYVAYGADRAVEAIRSRLADGVRVRLVLEVSSNSGGTLSYDSVRWLREQLTGIELLWWPTDRRPRVDGAIGALHAKAAVADHNTAVVSSANLTGRAMDANVELGLLLNDGNTPRVLRNQLDAMASAGIFVPVEPQ